MKIYTVDAFTNKPFKGNPAGVCIVDEFPDDKVMQSIATELNYSNSAFVKKLDDKHYHIRWFTPVSEAPLCGHATVGTLHVLSSNKLINRGDKITFESMSGQLFGRNNDGWYELDFPLYPVNEVKDASSILNVVNQTPEFVGFSQNCYFMEFENEQTLLDLRVDLAALKNIECRALIATAHGTQYDFHSRYFAPSVGIDEDPVCASAHCRLIPYWSNKLRKDDMLAYQSSKRGGIIKCKNLGNRVLISGEAVTVMEANLIT
jgi:predicted PhzF superfamily epimerase YddE/YHI9